MHTAYNNLEGWLGPVEFLCLQAGSMDLQLLLTLRRIQRVVGQALHLQNWVLLSFVLRHKMSDSIVETVSKVSSQN